MLPCKTGLIRTPRYSVIPFFECALNYPSCNPWTKRVNSHLDFCKLPYVGFVLEPRAQQETNLTRKNLPREVEPGTHLKHPYLDSGIVRLTQLDAQADLSTYAFLLPSCRNPNTLSEGKIIHDHIIRSGLERNTLLTSILIQVYGKCGALDDALALFSKMQQQNVSLWNFIVSAYCRQGNYREALQLFEQMLRKQAKPDRLTVVNLLSACASLQDLAEGERIHHAIKATGFAQDVFVGTAIVRMYGKCGSLEAARRTFDQLSQRDVVSWTTMIAICAQHERGMEAIQLLNEMEKEGIKPDKVAFVCVLDACARSVLLAEGENLHARIVICGFELDVVVGTTLVNMYGKCGNLMATQRIFDKMSERNVVSWNTIISVYAQHAQGKEAIQLFDQMQHEIVKPDRITFVSVLEACASHAALAEGKQMHSVILNNGLEGDEVLGNALVNMYGKCGSPKDAKTMFDKSLERSVVSWNTLIAVYAHCGQCKDVLRFFEEMLHQGVLPDKITFVSIFDACASCNALLEGEWLHSRISNSGLESDIVVGTALINMYGKCGSLKDAETMFNMMPQKNVVSWNSILAMYAQHGQSIDTVKLFDQMHVEEVQPDKITLSCILDACANCGPLTEGEHLHRCIMDTGHNLGVVLGTALVNMYGKCGSLEDARRVFDRLLWHDIVAWTTMIALYGQHGQGMEGLQLFHQMKGKGVKADKHIFVSVLTACSHAGLIDEGHRCFASMMQDYHVSPVTEHYVCMVDLLGRAGQLEEAETFIREMLTGPTTVCYLALLSACRYQFDVARAEYAAQNVFDLDPDDVSSYVMLSNVYAAVT